MSAVMLVIGASLLGPTVFTLLLMYACRIADMPIGRGEVAAVYLIGAPSSLFAPLWVLFVARML